MNPLLLDKTQLTSHATAPPSTGRQAGTLSIRVWKVGCPWPLGGNGCDPCFEVNIAQRMALGHNRKVIRVNADVGAAFDRRSMHLARHANKDATTLPPRYNGRFCDSVSRRAEFLLYIAPPIGGPGGTPVSCRGTLYRRQPY